MVMEVAGWLWRWCGGCEGGVVVVKVVWWL